MKRGFFGLGCWVGGLGLVLVSLGCGTNPLQRLARSGSLAELARGIKEQAARRPFDEDEIERLASWVAEREILSTQDPHGAEYLELLSPCVTALRGPLSERAKAGDETGNQALVMLVRAGKPIEDEAYQRLSHGEDGSARAVAATAALHPVRHAWRRQAILDADPRVRRAALVAASVAPSPDDRETLVDALRRDPDPVCQQLAARALGRLPHSGSWASLRDAWIRGDAELRIAIAQSYAEALRDGRAPATPLLPIAEMAPGLPGTLAAEALTHAPPKSRWVGYSRLVHDLAEGTETEQLIALRAATFDDPDQNHQLHKLAREGTGPVLAAASGRMLDGTTDPPSSTADATKTLVLLASGNEPGALLAREILAERGNLAALEPLHLQLKSRWAATRAAAARNLLVLSRQAPTPRGWLGVAQALGDDAPDVRLVTACRVLERPRTLRTAQR